MYIHAFTGKQAMCSLFVLLLNLVKINLYLPTMYKCMYIIYYLGVLMGYHRTPHKLRLCVVFYMQGVLFVSVSRNTSGRRIQNTHKTELSTNNSSPVFGQLSTN